MNNRPSAQTLMVRPVSSTTLTFDGKSEKFELFEDLFHTMIKMQPDMTETMKINHFHSLLRKNALQTFRKINTANMQTLEDILAVFRRKYVKPESQATAKHKWHRLVFDPNTMKLTDFLEELNQGAEKAFGENAQAMIDSLLYAKLPPKLKRSVNMTRLENATYEEIVTHLERELELNGLEEGDDIPVPTMSTAPTATRPGTGLLSAGIDPNITCNYCKKPGHIKDDCRKLKRKEEQRRNEGQDNKKEYPKCPTCDKTNHPAERCWKGAGAHLKPKNLKLEDTTTTTDQSTSQDDIKNKQTNNVNFKEPKKLAVPRLQINDKLRVRQYIISDPSNVHYTEYYTSLTETSSADWQQQMKTPPTTYTTSDPMSNRLQTDTTTIRLIPLIDDYNPYYSDPDYGFDPYWDVNCYNQHHLYFYRNLNKPSHNIELDSNDIDQALNMVLAKARVDPWQHETHPIHHTTHPVDENELHRAGPQVSLATAVTARSVNTLITRTGEPDYVPLTTNLGLKYKRRMRCFPMDFGELTLDGLVDTGALSSAIPEADLRKIRLLAPQSIVKEGPAPNFQIMVANGQLETPKSTVELKFEVGDIEFHEIFIVMEKLTSPLIGLSFLQRNNTILDMRQGVLNFPFFSMQLKTADHKYTNVMEPICIREDVTIPPNDRHSVLMPSQLYEDTAVTGILQPSNTLTDDGDIAFCAALVTLTNGQVSVHLNNFTDSPYTLKRGTQVANFTVLTPEQMK